MRRTGKMVLACLLAASAMLTACGGSGDTGSAGSAGTTTQAAAIGGESRKDGIIRVGMSSDITSLDPHANNDVNSSNATRHIYNNLVRVTNDGEVLGDLAESWEFLDDMNVQFKLKEGVKFSDGTPLTSEDVKFSLERQKASAKVGHLVAMIDNVEVVDDLTFIIHMNQPSNALLTSLAHAGGAILCKSYTEKLESEGKKLADAPMGTGPYTFVSWMAGTSVELKKNPNYFDPERAAKNEGLILKAITEETSRTIALENGEIDVLLNVGTNDAQKIRENSNLILDEFECAQNEMVVMNTTKPPFDNKLVRQAVNYAVNKEDALIVAINGEGTTIDGYLAPAAIGAKDTAVKYEYNPEKAKELLADMTEVSPDNIIIYGNSSLNVMYDTVARSMTHGVMGSTPWCKLDKVKFLCPVPGYDRHFKITEHFGIDMINIPMHEDGPDMDMVEEYVNNDPAVKGIWCVPKYSNPQGITYSDETVRRFARLKPAAEDFRIYWDNAYGIHHLYEDKQDNLVEILMECKKEGNPDMVYKFCSTSKVSFPGSGVAAIGTSKANIADIKKQMTIQTIGHDKLNQLRHVRFFKDIHGMVLHMRKHADILRPKFETVLSGLKNELGGLEIGSWLEPRGGYFISFDSLPGCAKAIVAKAKEAGVVMTDAGATFPYGKDPQDSNIRIAPSYPTPEELKTATEIFVLSVKLVSIDKILEDK